jgi:hypothetical protein
MVALLCFFLALLASPFKSKSRLEAENEALRHQLIILRRKVRGPRPAHERRSFVLDPAVSRGDVLSVAPGVWRTVGPQHVFIDTDSIRMGDDWPERIDNALASATILIPVIGPNWLKIADDYGRR